MDIPQIFRQIPDYLDNACQYVDRTSHRAADWIVETFQSIHDNFVTSSFWIQIGKPFYDRKIKPLDRTDLITISASIILAVLVMKLALKIFGRGILPLAAGIGTLIVGGAIYYSHYRLQKHFDVIAWDHVDNIRRFVHATTTGKHHFGKMARYRILLNNPEFGHLEDRLKMLDTEQKKFEKAARTPQMQDQLTAVKAQLTAMNAVPAIPQADKDILKALETEVDHIGTKDEDITKLQDKKVSLNQLQNAILRTYITGLTLQIEELIKASKNPTFKDMKEAFLAHLEGLQNYLAAHKQIDKDGLPVDPPDEENIIIGDVENPNPVNNPPNPVNPVPPPNPAPPVNPPPKEEEEDDVIEPERIEPEKKLENAEVEIHVEEV